MGNVLKAKWFKTTVTVLVVVGALAWGLYALNFMLVDSVFGNALAKWVYGLVGLAGVFKVIDLFD